MVKFTLLTERDVRAVLSVDDLIEPMERALAAFSAGEVVQPLRSVVATGRGFLGVMPGYVPDEHSLGAKLVTVFGGNADAGLPSHLATIVIMDDATGQLRAVIDGRYITEIRTAAVSAAAARHLARADASHLALLGSGVQARSHLLAMNAVRPLASVRVWSPNSGHVERFVDEMRHAVRCPIDMSPDADTCVRDADLVVAATAARTPVVHMRAVRAGAHITAVGACRPDERELEPALVARSRLFVDSVQSAMNEAGDVVLGIREGVFGPDIVQAEIGEVVARKKPGRLTADEVTIFKSLGLAVEDVVAARLALARATEQGIGRMLDV